MSVITESTEPRTRSRVGWPDLLWVTWRQHRALLLTSILLTLVGIALALSMTGLLASRNQPMVSLLGFDALTTPARWVLLAEQGFGVFIAVFWAAPLVSAEYERRTNLLAWSQDVSPLRWLTGKVALLLPMALVLAGAVGFAGKVVADHYHHDDNFRQFDAAVFEASPLLQVGFAGFGFALGLALSVITRRTVLSMALTLGIFAVVRFALIPARPYYLTPERDFHPIGQPGWLVTEHDIWLDAGYLNTAGEQLEFPPVCQNLGSGVPGGRDECLRGQGIVGVYYDYQPAGRVPVFQLIEFGVFAALAALLFVVTWRVVRRVQG
ncbi:ABC transporter permease subunit [Amycolatopsis magusensis]|uniref:ABC transporter permease subunit n=1 Tax=Amycolatopsis magusensis TaxID=882444 RepID=UPI0024A8E2C6|nr:ABC transporter permease subunit [Amycolatopsis magusensis]MDI5977039.1 ABC transporter permease subunit [Amycolatopsis magusensis]